MTTGTEGTLESPPLNEAPPETAKARLVGEDGQPPRKRGRPKKGAKVDYDNQTKVDYDNQPKESSKQSGSPGVTIEEVEGTLVMVGLVLSGAVDESFSPFVKTSSGDMATDKDGCPLIHNRIKEGAAQMMPFMLKYGAHLEMFTVWGGLAIGLWTAYQPGIIAMASPPKKKASEKTVDAVVTPIREAAKAAEAP